MKKYLLTVMQLFALLTIAFAQVPATFNMQIAFRNDDGLILFNQDVSIRISIQEGENIVFSETHNATTNPKGIATIAVGSIDANHTFSLIPWHKELHIKLETKLPNENNFSLINTSPLLAVPYALFTNFKVGGETKPGNTIWHNGLGWVSTSQIQVDADKVEVAAQHDRVVDEPIFVVRNSKGEVVFAVNESGVAVYVDKGDGTKGNRGGFVVGGFSDQTKAESPSYMSIMPDEVQFNIQQNNKGNRGGFVVGGFSDQTKAVQNFMVIQPDSVKITLHEETTKGERGGLTVGGFSDQTKGFTDWLRLNRDTTYISTTTLNLNEGISAKENINVGGNTGTLPLTDIDKNKYNTVRIGNKIWMAENLKVKNYRDGSPIITGLNDTEWNDTTMGAYNLYPHSGIDDIESDAAMLSSYGLLYNAYATSDSRGLCPTGWVMPSQEDWNQLVNTLGGNDAAGGALKSTRTDDQDLHPRWDAPNEGANNFSGFSAYPGGLYNPQYESVYYNIGFEGHWWLKENMSYYLEADNQSALEAQVTLEFNGLSVRCIKSSITQPSLELSYPKTITPNTADVSAKITKEGGAPALIKGFVWSTNPFPCIEINDGVLYMEGTSPFNAVIVDLKTGTNYYLRAFATNAAGTTYSKPITFKTGEFKDCGTLTDVDDNEYTTIKIKDQCWMQQNLKTTKYNDKTEIGDDYIMHTNSIYGALYKGNAVTVDNLCPTGWSIPSSDDFDALINYLGNDQVAGGKLKSPGNIPDNTGLWEFPNTGATNESGFTGLPAGCYEYQSFNQTGEVGYWWSNSNGIWKKQGENHQEVEKGETQFALSLTYEGTETTLTSQQKSALYSVRCLWRGGLPFMSEPITSKITTTSFNISIKIIDDGGNPASPLTARGFVVGLKPNPTIEDNEWNYLESENIVGELTRQFSDLTPNTSYYVKAYASNNKGTNYSTNIIVKTYKDKILDIQGNEYFTTQIGDQDWMAQNLNTTKFKDNTGISLYSVQNKKKFYTVNPDQGDNAVDHGKFYSYGLLTDQRGICPEDWRIPFIEDWELLIDFLGGENIAGAKMKTIESLGSGSWEDNMGATNESGFSAVPAGMFNSYGAFVENSHTAFFWSSTLDSEDNNRNKSIFLGSSSYATINSNYGFSQQLNADDALSIRCIKNTDTPALKTNPVSNITYNTASSGGEVIYMGKSEVISVGLVWSKNPLPTIDNNMGISTESFATPFTSQATSLEINTKYYLRAYATNSEGTGYGNQVIFNTASENLNSEDFESGTFANAWIQGNLGWVIDHEPNGQGNYSARSQYTDDSQNPTLSIFFESIGGQVKFSRKIDSKQGYSTLTFFVNGEEKGFWATDREWQQMSITIPAGFNMLTWEFSSNKNQNCAWIDSILFPPTNYPEIVIGQQTWMAQNLNVVKYKNGDPIHYIFAGSNPEANVPYYTHHPDPNAWGHTYGMVYSHGVIKDDRGLCPVGWRLPDNSDWTELFNFLGGVTVAGGKLKTVGENIPGLWDAPNTGATNESGFSAIPAGYQGSSGYYYGTPSGQPQEAYFWSATIFTETQNTVYNLTHDSEEVFQDNIGSQNSRENAVSVRCIKIP